MTLPHTLLRKWKQLGNPLVSYHPVCPCSSCHCLDVAVFFSKANSPFTFAQNPSCSCFLGTSLLQPSLLPGEILCLCLFPGPFRSGYTEALDLPVKSFLNPTLLSPHVSVPFRQSLFKALSSAQPVLVGLVLLAHPRGFPGEGCPLILLVLFSPLIFQVLLVRLTTPSFWKHLHLGFCDVVLVSPPWSFPFSLLQL